MPTSNNTNNSGRPSLTGRSSISNRQRSITAMKQEELLSVQAQFFTKPDYKGLSKWQRVNLFFWDPKMRTVMGRTAASWGKVGLFYLIFYGVLAALVAICMWVFFQTLDPRIPRWQLDRSIIGSNPGMGFRPMPYDNLESTLIWFQGSNRSSYEKWENNTKAYLDKYYTPGKIAKGTSPTRKCSFEDPPIWGQVCDVDPRSWGDCNYDQHFNYHRNSPCIFVKLNRIYGWVPEYYNDTENLPANMPRKLVEHIKSVPPVMRNTVWISCQGENPADVEYLGAIEYYPKIQGYPGYYYPYLHTDGYLSPLVAVRFLRPTSGIIINVECKAWAKNIKHNRAERQGSVHFELLID